MRKNRFFNIILVVCLLMSCMAYSGIYAAVPETIEPNAPIVLGYVSLSKHSATLSLGEGMLLTATLGPAASGNYISWQSSNPNVATVTNGYVVAHSSGTATITVFYEGPTSQPGSITDTCTVTVLNNQLFENGTYFIQNVTTKTYLDISGDYSVEGAQIHMWELTGNHSRKWKLKFESNGYYTIQSYHSSSNRYIGINKNSTSTNGTTVHQYLSNTGHNTHWSFMLSDSGNYVLIPRSGEGNMYALKTASTSTANRVIVNQNVYTDNTNYQDEWKLHRMSPLNGYELAYGSAYWPEVEENEANVIIDNNNCYAYAINNQTWPNGEIWYKQQPGQYSGTSSAGFETDNYGGSNEPILVGCLLDDFEKHNENNSTSLTCQSIGQYQLCPNGTYKIALVVDPKDGSTYDSFDYHWYRQDADGLWSHKRGITTVTRKDASGNLIIDPKYANRNYGNNNYSIFVGYFAITPWNHYYGTLSSEYLSLEEELELMSDITVSPSAFNNIAIGMTVAEVASVLGSLGEDVGSGRLITEYLCTDGSVVIIGYDFDLNQNTFVVSEISNRSVI